MAGAGQAFALPDAWWDAGHTSAVAGGLLRSAGVSEKKCKATLNALAARLMVDSYGNAADRPQ